jgi:hypothetical protein
MIRRDRQTLRRSILPYYCGVNMSSLRHLLGACLVYCALYRGAIYGSIISIHDDACCWALQLTACLDVVCSITDQQVSAGGVCLLRDGAS